MTSALRLGLVSRIKEADLPASHSYSLAPGYPTPGSPILLRPSIAHPCKYGNINPFSIRYGFRPLLRDRLTLGRLTLPRKPWIFGVRAFHPHFRILMPAFSFLIPPAGITSCLPRPTERSPTTLLLESTTSVTRLVPIILGAEPLDQ